MAIPPDYVFPEVGDEIAAGESYYSGNKVFTSEGDNETWDETNKPDDDLGSSRAIEERLQEIEEALGI